MIRTLIVSFETTTHAHQTLFPLRHPRHPRQWLVTQTALAWATLTVDLHHGRRSPFARRPPPPQPSSESTHESPCAATHGCNTPRLNSLHEPRTLGDRKDKASTRTEALFLQLVAAQSKESLHLLATAKTSHLAAARGLPEPCDAAQKNGVLTGRHSVSVRVVMISPESRRKISSAEHVSM